MAFAPSRSYPLRLFFSYAHQDQRLIQRLRQHLKQLEHDGIIQPWSDRDILAGDQWRNSIDDNLQNADIVLLCISPAFIASEYCYAKEMQLALQRHAEGRAIVVPIILRPTDWRTAPFAHLQALPSDALPVTEQRWGSQDVAFLDITTGIRKLAASLVRTKQAIPTGYVLEAAVQPRAHVNDSVPVFVYVRPNRGREETSLHSYLERAVPHSTARRNIQEVAFQIRPDSPGPFAVTVHSPSFRPEEQERRLPFPDLPKTPNHFVARARFAGQQFISVLVHLAGISLTEHLLGTVIEAPGQPATPAPGILAQVTLTMTSEAEATTSGGATATA